MGDRKRTRAGIVSAALLTAGLLAPTPAPAAAELLSAKGEAYGGEVINDQKSPLVTAAVPPGQSRHAEDVQLDAFGLVETLRTIADACLTGGVNANLQAEMDEARRVANDQPPPPKGQEPPRRTVRAPEGYGVDDFCLQPQDAQLPEDPNNNPKCEKYGAAKVPPGGSPPATCQALIELWSARAYVEALNAFVFSEISSEAVGRCVGSRPEYQTAVAYGPLTGSLAGDTSQPNSPISIAGLAEGSTVTFWETNWDPKTNTVTDGKDHVWVNALHIDTPTEDIIIGHAEAKVECGGDEVPAGGFPRTVTLNPSKRLMTWDRPFTLSGAVTPASEFDTPAECVEGVPVTIARDRTGGPNKFKDMGVVETDINGNFSLDFDADYNAQWIAYIDKDTPANCAQVASEATEVLVRPFVGLKTSQKLLPRGRTVRLTARLAPCDDVKVGSNIKLRRVYKSRSVKIETKRLDESCRAVFRQKANWKTAVFDAAWSRQDGSHQNGKSRPKVVRTKKKKK